jgi:hypothetical protein
MDWKHRVLVMMSGCLPLSAACSSHSDSTSGSTTQTSEPVICQGVCVYQSNTDDTCASGPQPAPDRWVTACMDVPCADVPNDPMESLDPISGCVTSLVYRNWSRFGGTCDDWNQAGLQLPGAGAEPEGIACMANTDCASNNCVGTDSFNTFCANDCEDGGSCSAGFACEDGYCVPPCLQ